MNGLIVFIGGGFGALVRYLLCIILPISISGGLGYLISGHLDLNVFIQSFAGLTTGTYIGAKFTRLIPSNLLRYIMVSMPISGAIMLILKSNWLVIRRDYFGS